MRKAGIVLLFLSALLGLAESGVAQRGEPRFLLISDIHFDPFADPDLFEALQSSPASDWQEIFAAGASTGFAQAGSDSNYALLASSLDSARMRISRPDFVLYGGDLLAHGWQSRFDALAPVSHLEDPAAYQAFTAKVLRFLAEMFRTRFPHAPIFATLGNEDAFCGDYQLEPGGEFLEAFARSWGPLRGVSRRRGRGEGTLARGGYYSTRLPGRRATRLVVLNTVFFATDYTNPCGSSLQTPALDQLRWLERTLRSARRRGEEVWLLMHIPPGIDSYATERDAGWGGAPVSFWQRELTSRFVQLMKRSRRQVRIAFAAHTHMDDYRVIRLGERPLLLSAIAPAVSPIFGNDPGYQVYDFSRSGRSQTLDFETMRLANLPSGGSGDGGSADWQFEYRFSEAYGFGPLDASAVSRLAHALSSEGSVREDYTRFYPVGAEPQFDASSIDIYRCAILNVSVGEFQNCLTATTPDTGQGR